MGRDKRTMLEKVKDILDSPEGKETISLFAKKLDRQHRQKERNLERFTRMVEHTGLEQLIDRITTKYDSDEYNTREWKMGYYETREPLSGLVYDYFSEHGEETEEGSNDFMVGNFRIGSYVVGLMIGQGSYIMIQKIIKDV